MTPRRFLSARGRMIDLTDKGRLVATDISGSHQSVLDADVTMKEIPRPGLQSVWSVVLKMRQSTTVIAFFAYELSMVVWTPSGWTFKDTPIKNIDWKIWWDEAQGTMPVTEKEFFGPGLHATLDQLLGHLPPERRATI